jgi:antitoxin PrlF
MHYHLVMKLFRRLLGQSTLTDRYQTTIPNAVRAQLGLGKRDLIEFVQADDGSIVLRRAETFEADEFPEELISWLGFIDKDQKENPQQLQVLDETFFVKAKKIVGDLDVDLEADLGPDTK